MSCQHNPPSQESEVKKPFGVRLIAQNYFDGSTYERTYVRGVMRVNKQAFTEYAIGNFLMLIAEQNYSNLREFSIMSVRTLTADELYAIWLDDATQAVKDQQAIVRDYIERYYGG
jgi:hypothetical protein